MTTVRTLAAAIAVLILPLLAPSVVLAQSGVPRHPWDRCTTAGLLIGAATASSDTGLVAGGGFGWRFAPRLALDVRTAWLDRQQGMDAFAASLTAQAFLAGSSSVAPFLRAGLGMYRTSIDESVVSLPDFYARRLRGGSGLGATQAFTDPSVVLGGGVSVFVSRRIALQPEIETTIVFRNSRSYAVTAATIQFAYHFEDPRITPAIAARRVAR